MKSKDSTYHTRASCPHCLLWPPLFILSITTKWSGSFLHRKTHHVNHNISVHFHSMLCMQTSGHNLSFFHSFFLCWRIKLTVSHMLSICYTPELHPQLFLVFSKMVL
jgi:hypothetical protein